jgi:hypothetical protein
LLYVWFSSLRRIHQFKIGCLRIQSENLRVR